MERWRAVILEKFGKRTRHKWYAAALDFQLVDLRIKPSCLFDYWAVSPEDMQNFTQDLYKQGLTKNIINVLTIGQDVVIYSSRCDQSVIANNSECRYYIDVTSYLLNPVLTDKEKVFSTIDIFDKLCSSVNDICRGQDVTHVHFVDIDDRLNVPCLFGMLLGYPCVYWYDVTKGDDHCLSGQVLHLFQVKGHVKEKSTKPESVKFSSTGLERKNAKLGSTDNSHVIFSFSVPVSLLTSVQDHVECWFNRWKEFTLWSHLFDSVWLHEKTVSPQAVCL